MRTDVIEKIMDGYNKKHEGYGVEAIFQSGCRKGYWANIAALYVNMGETYATTLVWFVDDHKFRITTMGDAVEYLESQGEIIP